MIERMNKLKGLQNALNIPILIYFKLERLLMDFILNGVLELRQQNRLETDLNGLLVLVPLSNNRKCYVMTALF